MPKIKVLYPRTSTWGELSDKLVKHYRLPTGSRFGLRRKGKASGTRHLLRADSEVRRKLFRRDDHPRYDQVRVADICRNIEAMLAPGSRSSVVALKPNAEPLDGKTMLRKWREMPGRITQEERDAAEMHRIVVEDLRRLAVGNLADLEEAVEDPPSEVTEAVIRALADRYGDQSVRDSFRRLRL
jgi:hypothetical protein